MIKRGRLFRGFLAIVCAAALSAAPATGQERSATASLSANAQAVSIDVGALEALIEKARVDWRVPGLGVAVVRGNEVLLLRGFGFRDVDRQLPVTPETYFVGASTTKAFAAASVALLVDEGKLDWDVPVRSFLPEFRLKDQQASELVTLRDMLSHRTGLPRHDYLWYNNQTDSRADLVAKLAFLELNDTPRNRWQYNNLMYMAVGQVVERVTGLTWEEFTRQRLFGPLGIDRAVFRVSDMQADPDHAKAYKLGRTRQIEEIPTRPVDVIGPAGALNASTRAYAQWLRLHLGGGQIGGRRVISSRQMTALHAPVIAFSGRPEFPEFSQSFYSLGWFTDTYRGSRRLEHGGNLDGFNTLVTLYPDEGLGIVVWANLENSSLPQHLSLDIADRVLGRAPVDWSVKMLETRNVAEAAQDAASARQADMRIAQTQPAHRLAQYTGSYKHPAYGQVDVTLSQGALRALYHGVPMRLEHWHYEVFNSVPDLPGDDGFKDFRFQFQTNLNGSVSALALPLEPAVSPILFTKVATAEQIAPARLARFEGRYLLEGRRVEIRRERDGLALLSPEQEPLFFTAAPDGGFEATGQVGLVIRFVERAGLVTKLQMLRPDGLYEAQRIVSQNDEQTQ
jgi:CubicO group peptidase (beta-lactamase class C family)